MVGRLAVLLCIVSGLLSTSASARTHAVVALGQCAAQDGATIENCQVGYTRYGTPNDDFSNVIIVPTWLPPRAPVSWSFSKAWWIRSRQVSTA